MAIAGPWTFLKISILKDILGKMELRWKIVFPGGFRKERYTLDALECNICRYISVKIGKIVTTHREPIECHRGPNRSGVLAMIKHREFFSLNSADSCAALIAGSRVRKRPPPVARLYSLNS